MLRRLLVVKAVLLLVFLVVAARLMQIQVLDAARYQRMARKQYDAGERLLAMRGNMFDRNGRLIVSSVVNVSFAADPQVLGDKVKLVADKFGQAFGKPRSEYQEKLAEPTRRFVWLERSVPPERAQRINLRQLGTGLLPFNEPRRAYHYNVAGALIGATDVDNKGITGTEKQLDSILRGTDGYRPMQRDALGRTFPVVDKPPVEPVNGKNIVLTIDIDIQTIVEDELRRGVASTDAEAGLVVVLEPSTGEVLALAQYPSFDPLHLGTEANGTDRVRAITDMFEPGSLFKVVTASAAIEEDLVKVGEKFSAENGRYVRIVGREKRVINDTHPYGILTFEQAVQVSSNIVFAKVSDRIGAERLYTMARNYGFGTETGLELPGEIRGELKKPNQWSGTTLNSMAYGYEVGVTPLQIATAYCAVANGGTLMKPFLVKKVIADDGEILGEARPQSIRTVINKETARTLTHLLEGVVENGTGQAARVAGLRIAGKTGTSRKNVDGKYETTQHAASFAGYFPADDPKIVCLVMLDHPREGPQTGGLASAPIFREIAKKVYGLPHRWATTRVLAQSTRMTVPDVVSMTADVALQSLAARGYQAESRGVGTIVRSQNPAAGTVLLRGGKVGLVLVEGPTAIAQPGYAVVPSLLGLPMRRAVSMLALQHLDIALSGSGLVVAQAPAPGTQVKRGSRVVVRCEPRSLSLLSRN